MRKIYLLIFCSLLMVKLSIAQTTQTKLISVNYQQAGIESIVTDLESKTGYHFYYDKVLFDSLKVTVKADQKPLTGVLDAVFQNTAFHYAIANGTDVFLTRTRVLEPMLAEGFFDPVKQKAAGQAQSASKNFTVDDKTTKAPEATIENKVYAIGTRTNTIQPGSATMAGYVRNAKTGEPIIGASMFVADTKAGVATDGFGFYSLTLPKGPHTIIIKALGNRDTRRQIILYGDGKLNIELQEQIQALREVKISADKVANVRGPQMGAVKLDIKTLKDIPAVFGETDVLRAVTLLPGVQTVGEATTGFNVRGGSADQNLILFNGSTIYNPAHFFGFFSAFNPELIKDVELHKSTIPEKFGGRLASVLEINDREGNKKKFTGSAGIGLLTSRLNVEGPIGKGEKTSFLLGGRVTYSDWLLKSLPQEYKNSQAQFYDVNLDINHHFNEKNDLYVYGYMSQDGFKLNSDTNYKYSNKNANIKWKHNYNNKLYSVIGGGFDHYDYNIASSANPVNAYQLKFNINQTNFKTDFNYYPNTAHTVTFGLSSSLYRLHPGSFTPNSATSLVKTDNVPGQQALESALYLGDKFDVTDKLTISAGLRYSLYNFMGPYTVNNYAPGQPRTAATLIDSVKYGSGASIKTYGGPEIRVSARYVLGDNLSVKAAYNTMRQYIHQLSNTTAISPTDIYQLSDPNIKPQFGDQVSLGFYRNFENNTIETSVEGYYKHLKNYLDYRDGATLVLNHHLETDVIGTRGKAYGIEFLVRKTAGKLTGLASYTYSRILLQQNDPGVASPVNHGEYYPANYDKPHDFNFTGSYHISHRYSFAVNMVYSTGRPITLPIAKYYYGGSERVYYTDRNASRIPDYFRTDLSVTLEGNHRLDQRFHDSWTFGIYNLSGRQNAYSTYFSQEGGVIHGYKLSIFATAIPFVNYNIRF
ncbi:TonB-dependent receptor [Mucilaginibacter mali]|uniref:TonB-dependent receptor n=1 Tax=Mucilaginibacter mali TaxID=2740462 RepID=A0A7D4UCW5_9SPHI|nr:TonB-dependent receptor [Mucilaginibacter mali]QKJ32038.1 TonB-dependent receptor [Mucilaginibacter mali]